MNKSANKLVDTTAYVKEARSKINDLLPRIDYGNIYNDKALKKVAELLATPMKSIHNQKMYEAGEKGITLVSKDSHEPLERLRYDHWEIYAEELAHFLFCAYVYGNKARFVFSPTTENLADKLLNFLKRNKVIKSDGKTVREDYETKLEAIFKQFETTATKEKEYFIYIGRSNIRIHDVRTSKAYDHALKHYDDFTGASSDRPRGFYEKKSIMEQLIESLRSLTAK